MNSNNKDNVLSLINVAKNITDSTQIKNILNDAYEKINNISITYNNKFQCKNENISHREHDLLEATLYEIYKLKLDASNSYHQRILINSLLERFVLKCNSIRIPLIYPDFCENLFNRYSPVSSNNDSIIISNMDVSNQISFESMFSDMSGIKYIELNNFSPVRVSNTKHMFHNLHNITIHINNWTIKDTFPFENMFSQLSNATIRIDNLHILGECIDIQNIYKSNPNNINFKILASNWTHTPIPKMNNVSYIRFND